MKQKAKTTLFENRYIIAAFFCSVLIVTVTYALKHIYPFGDQTILRVDLYHQYAPYLEEFRSRVLNGESLLYSWEGGLGKDFIAQMAYYTSSPLNLLIFLFPQNYLPEALALLILLKICLSSSFFSAYLKLHFRKNDCSILIFGLLYAFCAFITCYYWNVMWLDTVMLFPIVVLGTERLVQKNRHGLYYLALTLTMIVNFYLAVLVCILTAGYFLVALFSIYKWKTDRSQILKISVRFAVVSILAALSSMFILAPVAIALSQTATSETAFPSFKIYDNIYQLFTSHFLGARASVLARNEDLPNIYSGVLSMVLLPLYYTNKRIARREKVLISALLIFMLLCTCVMPLDFLIHGLHFPSNLPHRYTFVYTFMLLYMAYSAFLNIQYSNFRFALWTCIAYAAAILVLEHLVIPGVEDIDRVLSDPDIVLNLILMLAYLVILFAAMRSRSGFSAGFLHILFVFVMAECLFSASSNIEDTGSREAYVKYISDAREAVAYLDEQEDGQFYRTEFRRFTTINDASLYHYRGFSQFSSLAPGGISSLIEHLGIAATSNSYRYYDPTPLIDAVFGLKYVMNKDEAYPKEWNYEYEQQFGTVWVYRNNRTLPLGFMTDLEITGWQTANSQPFAVQNDFVRKAAGIDRDMFTLITADSISSSNMEVSEQSGPACFSYKLTDPSDLSLIPTVTAEYTSDKDQYLYLYVDAANAQRFLFRNNSVSEDRELSAGRSLIDVGYVSAGEKIYVEFSLTKKGEFEKTYREEGTVRLYAASYDDSVFQEAYDQLSEHPYSITEFTDTRISGTVSTDEDGILLTSIPYTRGWNVYVDGKKTDKVSVGDDGLVGVELTAGEHEIVFRYTANVVIASIAVSLLGFGLFLLCSLKTAPPGSTLRTVLKQSVKNAGGKKQRFKKKLMTKTKELYQAMNKCTIIKKVQKLLSRFLSVRVLYRLFAAWLIIASVSLLQSQSVFTVPEFFQNIPFFFYILSIFCLWMLFCSVKSDALFRILIIAVSLIYFLIAVRQEHSVYFAIGCCCLAGGIILFALDTDLSVRFSSKSAWAAALGLICIFTVWIGGVCCLIYRQNWTPNFDFGIFSQMFYYMKETGLPMATCERDMLLSHFAVHISPVFYLILPIYMIFPSPQTLLVVQCLIVASGVIPLMLLCRHHKLSNTAAVLFSLCYVSSSAFIGGCLFYIHENNFLAPLVLWLILSLEKKKKLLSFLAAALVLSVKEDAAVYAAVIALYFIIRDWKEDLRTAGSPALTIVSNHKILIFLLSVVYFFTAIHFLSTTGDGAMTGRYTNYIYDSSGSLFTMIKAIFLNPVYVISQCFNEEKLLNILRIFIPLCFLPLISTKWQRLILLIPYVLINLMSTYSAQNQIGYQYYFGSVSILFYLSIINYADLHRLRKKMLLTAVCSSLILTLSQHQGEMLNYYPDYLKHGDERAVIQETLSQIPDDAVVVATSFLVPPPIPKKRNL